MATPALAPAPEPVVPNIADWPYRFEIVQLKFMQVDQYQRPLTSFVDKIVENFNPALIGTLCLSQRSKTKFMVIDGQTRAEGMRRLGMEVAPCVVFTSLRREDEARLFADFQTERRAMTSSSRFKSQVIAKHPVALAVNEIVEGLGFVIDQNQNGANAIRAVAACEFAYWGATKSRNEDTVPRPDLLAKVLETIRSAYPKLQDTCLSAVMIRGLAFYFAEKEKAKDNVDLARLARKLGSVQPSELMKRAQKLREGVGATANSPAYMAEAIEALYNSRGR